VAHWLQHTSRDGDMQLHVHSQIAHVARTLTDGKWRAPDSLGYNEHISAVAAIVSQHLEEALTRRFGLAWEARDDGHGFEIRGISGQMMSPFSSRRQSITADLRARAARFEQQYGRAPSQRELARLAQASNFRGRGRGGGCWTRYRWRCWWSRSSRDASCVVNECAGQRGQRGQRGQQLAAVLREQHRFLGRQRRRRISCRRRLPPQQASAPAERGPAAVDHGGAPVRQRIPLARQVVPALVQPDEQVLHDVFTGGHVADDERGQPHQLQVMRTEQPGQVVGRLRARSHAQ